jgi:hypothetical protein
MLGLYKSSLIEVELHIMDNTAEGESHRKRASEKTEKSDAVL